MTALSIQTSTDGHLLPEQSVTQMLLAASKVNHQRSPEPKAETGLENPLNGRRQQLDAMKNGR